MWAINRITAGKTTRFFVAVYESLCGKENTQMNTATCPEERAFLPEHFAKRREKIGPVQKKLWSIIPSDTFCCISDIDGTIMIA